jgi:hypothetical protein
LRQPVNPGLVNGQVRMLFDRGLRYGTRPRGLKLARSDWEVNFPPGKKKRFVRRHQHPLSIRQQVRAAMQFRVHRC